MAGTLLARCLLEAALLVILVVGVCQATALEEIKSSLKLYGIDGADRQYEALLGKHTEGAKKVVVQTKHVAIIGEGCYDDEYKLVFPVWLSDSDFTFNVVFANVNDYSDPNVDKVRAEIVAAEDVQILYKDYYDGKVTKENTDELKSNLFMKALQHIQGLAKISGNPTPTLA